MVLAELLRTLANPSPGLDELGDRVLDRDEVTAVLTVRLFDVRAGLVERGGQSSARVREFGFEPEDLLHAFEIDALISQLLNTSERR